MGNKITETILVHEAQCDGRERIAGAVEGI